MQRERDGTEASAEWSRILAPATFDHASRAAARCLTWLVATTMSMSLEYVPYDGEVSMEEVEFPHPFHVERGEQDGEPPRTVRYPSRSYLSSSDAVCAAC